MSATCLVGLILVGAPVPGAAGLPLRRSEAREPARGARDPAPPDDLLRDLDLLRDPDLGRRRQLLERFPMLESLPLLERLRLFEGETPVSAPRPGERQRERR